MCITVVLLLATMQVLIQILYKKDGLWGGCPYIVNYTSLRVGPGWPIYYNNNGGYLLYYYYNITVPTLHERNEGSGLATLSTPPGSAPAMSDSSSLKFNVMTVVSIFASSVTGLPARKPSGHSPNLITSISPGHRIWAVVEWDRIGRISLSGIMTWK